MKVSGVSGADMQYGGAGMAAGMGDQMDEVSRNLQKQIENLQKQVKELSANQDMPPETKMKKRQELQKQISELQIQLRQHQMEAKREEERKKEEKASEDNVFDSCSISEEGRRQSAGLSANSMEAMISADAALKQADIHGGTAKWLENREGILEAEINQDKGGPGDATAAKEKALEETKAAAGKATAAQMESLKQADEIMEEASEEDRKEVGGQAGDETEEAGAAGQSESTKTPEGKDMPGIGAQETTGAQQDSTSDGQDREKAVYHPVDVRI